MKFCSSAPEKREKWTQMKSLGKVLLHKLTKTRTSFRIREGKLQTKLGKLAFPNTQSGATYSII